MPTLFWKYPYFLEKEIKDIFLLMKLKYMVEKMFSDWFKYGEIIFIVFQNPNLKE
jgi:hypothetical protein